MRKPFVAGNWKMNTCRADAVALASGVAQASAGIAGVEVAVCPPFVYLAAVAEAIAGSPVQLAAQNMYFEPKGAFTGEISAAMLKDVGCRYAVLGHSERRHVFGETDELIAKKVVSALDGGLDVILCVGELLEERKAEQTNAVVQRQIGSALDGLTAEQMAKVTVAYEPVWAIGTGETATPEQAQEVHEFIRGQLSEAFGPDVAAATRIQYGGSVKPANAADLMSKPDVDGALVGGAALEVEQFVPIIQAGADAKSS